MVFKYCWFFHKLLHSTHIQPISSICATWPLMYVILQVLHHHLLRHKCNLPTALHVGPEITQQNNSKDKLLQLTAPISQSIHYISYQCSYQINLNQYHAVKAEVVGTHRKHIISRQEHVSTIDTSIIITIIYNFTLSCHSFYLYIHYGVKLTEILIILYYMEG